MKGFVKGLLFGSLAGTAGGLLFAPRRGKETQQKIIEEIEDWSRITSEFTSNKELVQTSLTNLKEVVTTFLPPIIDETQQTVEDFKFQAEPRIQQIKEQIEKIKNELPNNLN